MSLWDITGSIWLPKVNWRVRPAVRTPEQWLSAEDMNYVSSSIVAIVSGTAPVVDIVLMSASVWSSGTDGGSYGGLVLNPGLAEDGASNDPSGSLVSGTWTILSASGRLSQTDSSNVSASVSSGRLYALRSGPYWIHSQVSIEAVGNPQNWGGHISVFITGTQSGKWSQAMDMQRDFSAIIGVDALVYLQSGSYVDLRLRPDNNVNTLVTHHYQFLMHMVG